MIEFCGELSDKCKKSYLKATAKVTWIIVSLFFIIIGVPLIIVGVLLMALSIIAAPFVVVLFFVLAFPIGEKFFPLAKTLPVKVIIENGKIAIVNSKQVSKLNSESGGIDSLCVDGLFITSIKSVSEVIKVIDYGEWYCVFFNSRHVVTDYICQKDLIVKGSIEEFEQVFEGKIIHKF